VISCPFFRVNAVYRVSATSASDTQQPNWSSQIARGYRIGCQASWLIAATNQGMGEAGQRLHIAALSQDQRTLCGIVR
jgi:phenylalanyl-tRNA synthetase beta subunit